MKIEKILKKNMNDIIRFVNGIVKPYKAIENNYRKKINAFDLHYLSENKSESLLLNTNVFEHSISNLEKATLIAEEKEKKLYIDVIKNLKLSPKVWTYVDADIEIVKVIDEVEKKKA